MTLISMLKEGTWRLLICLQLCFVTQKSLAFLSLHLSVHRKFSNKFLVISSLPNHFGVLAALCLILPSFNISLQCPGSTRFRLQKFSPSFFIQNY